MTVLKPECVTRHSKRRFVVEERNSKVTFQNPDLHEIQEIRVDDCIITEGIRCDYLVNADQTNVSVFVELKGGDVKHAVDQIIRSYKELSQHRKAKTFWIVSSTRCPLTSTEIQLLTLRVRKEHGAELKVKNSPVEHTF